MKKIFFFLIILLSINHAKADRIYIMTSTGYNSCEAQLSTAIANNGHTVDINNVTGTPALPANFTTTCVDSINGYDYLCFFGDANFSVLSADIQAFIDLGGKVFYQYEVSCCTTSSSSIATILSNITGLSITPNVNAYISLGPIPAWEATNISCCVNIYGNAYKGLDGLPLVNQFQATATLGTSAPPISNCLNFGCHFSTTDFTGTANKGGFIGLGDFNSWYDGDEPLTNGGSTPINLNLINYFFPNDTSTCYLFPPGCLENISISSGNTIIVDIGNDTTLCQGDSIILDATTSGASYVWQGTSGTSTYTVAEAGTYIVTVSNSCGVGTDMITVSYSNQPDLNLGNDTLLCTGQTLNLEATDTNATYLWQDLSTDSTFIATQAGIYWVISDISGCTSTDTITINYIGLPSVNLGVDTLLCLGDSLILNAADSNATYLWQDTSIDSTLIGNLSGLYWVNVTNSCGTVTDSINITFLSPTVDIGNDTMLCPGQFLILNAQNTGLNYLWQDASINQTLNVNQTGTYWVQVSANNCIATDSINIDYIVLQNLNLGNDTIMCPNEGLTLDAFSTGSTYNWQDNSNLSSFTLSDSGTYYVDVITNDCLLSDTINVSTAILPQAIFISVDAACENESISFSNQSISGTGNIQSLTWDFGDNTSSNLANPTHAYSNSGIYTVTLNVISSYGCSNQTSFSIEIFEQPQAGFSFNPLKPELNQEVVFVDQSSGALTWEWEFGNGTSSDATNPSAIYTQSSTYSIIQIVTNSNCADTAFSSIVITEELIFYVPNAFTPDGSGFNETLKPIFTSGFDPYEFHFTVYNRWGEILFESYDPTAGWDGQYAKEVIQSGIYVWKVEFGDSNSDKQFKYSGHFTLLR